MQDIFCKIIAKEIPAEIVYETDEWLAIKDINPQAPVHILMIPKKHIANIAEIQDEDVELIGRMIKSAQTVAEKAGLGYKGFRLIANQGEDGGQLVPHLHFHLLGGKALGPKIVR